MVSPKNADEAATAFTVGVLPVKGCKSPTGELAVSPCLGEMTQKDVKVKQ